MPLQVSTSKAQLYHSSWHASTQSPSGASFTISIRDMFALVNLSREVSTAQVLSTSSLSFFTQQPITKLTKSLFPFCCRCFAAANSSSVFLIRFSTINSEMFKLESRRILPELAVDVEGSPLLSSVDFLFLDFSSYALTHLPVLGEPIVERFGCPGLKYTFLSCFVT